MFALVEKAKILRLPTDIVLELFETCVVPVLLYGAEIWGWENLNDIDIFHRNFLRNLLKTFKFTPNCMLYGETGSFNMSTKIKTRMINFWLNLKFGNPGKVSAILCRLTSKLHTEKHDTFHFKWVETVKSTLENTIFHVERIFNFTVKSALTVIWYFLKPFLLEDIFTPLHKTRFKFSHINILVLPDCGEACVF